MKKTKKKKTRADFGLPELTETEIRSNVMGVDVTITQSMIARVMKVSEGGKFLKGSNSTSEWAKEIFKELHEDRDSDKINDMRVEHRVLYKIILACLLPREGGTDQMSWDHKHLMLFLIRNMPVDFPQYIFNHLCQSLKENQSKKKRTVIPYGRLISEILHQGKLIQKLEAIGVASDEELGTTYGKVMNGMMLFHMNCGYKKIDIVTDSNDIKVSRQIPQYMDDFPPISREDNIEVIYEYVKQHFLETGRIITSDMIPDTAEGNWKPSFRKRKTLPLEKNVSKKAKTAEELAEEVASEATRSLLAPKAVKKRLKTATEEKKEKAMKAKTAKKKAKKMICSEDDEEMDSESIIAAKGKGLKHLKTINPEAFDELASGQAKQVQKLSAERQKLSNRESAELVQQTMKVKREAGASENQKGMPTPLAPSETINLDSPSPNKNQSSPKPTVSKPVSPPRTYIPYLHTDLEKKSWGRTLRMPPVSTVKPSDPNYNSPTLLFN